MTGGAISSLGAGGSRGEEPVDEEEQRKKTKLQHGSAIWEANTS